MPDTPDSQPPVTPGHDAYSGGPAEAASGNQLSLPELSGAALKGARAIVSSRLLIEATSFLSVIAVARLVDPAQMGRAAVALVFIVLAYVLTFEGFGSALVQLDVVTLEHRQTASTLSLAFGLVLMGLTAALGATVGQLIFGSDTALLIVLTSPMFLIASATSPSRSDLMRRLDFATLSRIDAWQNLAGSAATVTLAALGLGGKAIILGAVFSSVTDMLLQFRASPPPRPGWSRATVRDIASFGSLASANGLLITVMSNIDYVILALFLPARSVGIYYRAYQFGVQYQGKVTVVVQRMVFPLMSRATDPAAFRHVRQRSVEMNAMAALPLMGLLIVLAPKVVPLLYGPHWHDAVVPTQIMTGAGIVVVLLSAVEAPALALGRPLRVVVVTVQALVVYIIAITIGAQFGLIAACIASTAAHVEGLIVGQRYLIDKVIGLPAWQFLVDVMPATVSTLLAMVVVWPIEHLAGLPAGVTVIVGCLVGVTAYLLSMWVVFPSHAKRFLRVARQVMRSTQ